MSAPALRRPALRYYGGKWRIAPWVIGLMPPHDVYVEPFGGAGSVLLRKPRSRVEVYNDLDSNVVNFFSVLRDSEMAAELKRLVELTPFSREEHTAAFEQADCMVENARRMLVRSYMDFSPAAVSSWRKSGFNASPISSGGRKASKDGISRHRSHELASWPEIVPAITERLRGVVIENRDAIEVIKQQDSPVTLFYVDPPYLQETRRDPGRGYRHEMTSQDHADLLAALLEVKGMVMLNGYDSGMYNDALAGWRIERKNTRAHGFGLRTEVIWMNPAAAQAKAGLI